MTKMAPERTDQAETLRSLHKQGPRGGKTSGKAGRAARVFCVASGKGGVGKTAVVVHLAVTLARMGKRVLLIDADLGLANIDVVLNISPQYTLNDFFNGDRSLEEIVLQGPSGIKVLPAGSGMQHLSHLDAQQKMRFIDELDVLNEEVDIVLIDTEAGISENVTYFAVASHEALIVTTPEPAAITDAYALMKLLSLNYHQKRFHLVVNQVGDSDEGLDVYKKLTVVSNRYLDISIDYLGCVPSDQGMREAARQQKTMLDLFPESEMNGAFQALAKRMLATPEQTQPKGTPQFFWQHFMSMEAEGA